MSQYLLKILLFMWDGFFAVHLLLWMFPSTYVHKITYVVGSRLEFGNMFLFSKVLKNSRPENTIWLKSIYVHHFERRHLKSEVKSKIWKNLISKNPRHILKNIFQLGSVSTLDTWMSRSTSCLVTCPHRIHFLNSNMSRLLTCPCY